MPQENRGRLFSIQWHASAPLINTETKIIPNFRPLTSILNEHKQLVGITTSCSNV